MAKENNKVFGVNSQNNKNKEITEEERREEGVELSNSSSEDLIAQLKADSAKKSKSRKKKKIEEYKATRATRDAIFSRIGKTIDLPIIMDDNEVMVFQMKRLSEAENSEILDRSLAVKNIEDMTPEELEESNNYNYRLLEKVIVDPQITQEEWRLQVDTALVQKIVQQVMKVLTNVDNSRIFDDFQV